MLKRILIISFISLLVLSAGYGAICITHPVLGKWMMGDANNLGKPISACVYTDGQVNNHIIVYHDGNTHGYLLSLKEFDKDGMLRYINVDLDDKLIGRPVSTAKNDYEVINGSLYQSETGAHFVDFKNDMKGFNFDPQLTASNNLITFKVPPGWLKFSAIQIALNCSH